MLEVSNHTGKPPKYDEKEKKSFEMWIMIFKAWLHNVGCGTVLSSGFGLTLNSHEGKVLDLTKDGNGLEIVALGVNYKTLNGLSLAFETAQIMNKVIEEQVEDTGWPSGKFTKIWAQIKPMRNPMICWLIWN